VLPFTYVTYGPDGQPEPEKTVGLLPRREANDPNPVVGVLPPTQLRLPPRPAKESSILPVLKDSPAAAARPLPVAADEIIVAATDPDHPESVTEIHHDLKAGTFDVLELSRRVEALKGKKMVVRVLPKKADEKAKPEERDVPLEGFQWDDAIVGTTEVPKDVREDAYNPFKVSELPPDPRHAGGDQRDPFVFRNRLRQLVGKPIIIQVRRGDPQSPSPEHYPAGPTVNLFVPPAYHFTFGLRMKMGQVAGVRDDSPAAKAGVKKDDELIKITMLDQHGAELRTWEDLDPERLPFQLAQEASKRPGPKKVILTVRRGADRFRKDITCDPVDWEERWDNDSEVPLAARSPLAIPQLGLAYWVLSQIVEVKPGSPAARAGLKKDDTLKEYRFRQLSEFTREPTWSKWSPLETDRDGNKVYDCWASPFWYLQRYEYKEIEVKVKRPEEEVPDSKTLIAEKDRTWPLAARGLRMLEDYKIQKADSLGDALVMGGRETGDMIGLMYLQLRSLATGRVSIKQIGGPIAMVSHGFSIAQNDNYVLLLYLAMISINLAVVNFLPIPILDGGHMVFLIYEKLRGRPPTEKVRAIATYIGLAMIGFLMIFVFYQDIQNYVLNMFGS
jgi:regulator of sigma E protease